MKLVSTLLALFAMQTILSAANPPVHDFKIGSLDGKAGSLADYKGKVILLVNVASKCGLTPQYKALQGLHEKYQAKGFTVVGVPCNDFGGQEPGSSEEIRKFCTENFDVTFPLTEKVHVKGPQQHPLYGRLTGPGAEFPGEIKWNFGKFLIDGQGRVLKRFEPQVKPDAEEVARAIEAALAAK